MPRRKLNRLTRKDSSETPKSGDVEPKEPDELRSEPLRVQQQLLDDETRALQVIKFGFGRNLYKTCSICDLMSYFSEGLLDYYKYPIANVPFPVGGII